MKSSLKSTLWVYGLFQLVGAITSLTTLAVGNDVFDACSLIYGNSCNPAETVLFNYNALWKLHIGIILCALLSVSAGGDVLPSLAHYATVHAVAEFVGLTLFGAHMLQGTMDDNVHTVSMITHFVILSTLMLQLSSSKSTDAQATKKNVVAKSSSKKMNAMKVYLLIVAFYIVLWLLVNSDASVCTDVILDVADFTPLAMLQWNWWSIGCFENALLLIWVVRMGSVGDQKATCLALAALQVVAIWVVYMLNPLTTTTIYIMTTTSFTLMLIFGIGTVVKVDLSGQEQQKTKAY